MSADDPKRGRQRPEALSIDDEGPAEGAFFRAPTKAFQALPTEVLDVSAAKAAAAALAKSREEARKASARLSGRDDDVPRPPSRVTRLPASLFEKPHSDQADAFAEPPQTEALDMDEVRRLTRQHALIAADSAQDAVEVTNPDPFRVELSSEERALLEVAREPTQHDLRLEDLQGPPSETSTDVERPKPISGLTRLPGREADTGFEDSTLAIDGDALRGALPAARSPLSEPTYEDEALPGLSDELELELEHAAPSALLPPARHPMPPPMPPPPPNPTGMQQDRYYDELRGVVGAARVFDPQRPPHAITDPGFREDSDDWPEITMPPTPQQPPGRRRFPLGLVAFLLSALVVTVGGVGIGFSLSKRGVHLGDMLSSLGLGGASAEGASDDTESSETDEPEASDAAPIDPAGRWRGRAVEVYVGNVGDASGSGREGLAKTLQEAFASALASDEHAAWKVVSSRPRRGDGFALSLAVLSVNEGGGGAVEARCRLNGERRHHPRGELKVEASAVRRPEGSLTGADTDKLAREAARACGFALALAFFAPALAEPPVEL